MSETYEPYLEKAQRLLLQNKDLEETANDILNLITEAYKDGVDKGVEDSASLSYEMKKENAKLREAAMELRDYMKTFVFGDVGCEHCLHGIHEEDCAAEKVLKKTAWIEHGKLDK